MARAGILLCCFQLGKQHWAGWLSEGSGLPRGICKAAAAATIQAVKLMKTLGDKRRRTVLGQAREATVQ
jgi:hypothetical protein